MCGKDKCDNMIVAKDLGAMGLVNSRLVAMRLVPMGCVAMRLVAMGLWQWHCGNGIMTMRL